MKKKSHNARTSERRKTRQPLAIDRLPMEVHESIKRLRNRYALSWAEIERLSSLPYGEKWEEKIGSAGFVNWDALSTPVMELFPRLRLQATMLHRWYDIRVEQKIGELEKQSEVARVVGESFAKRGMEGAPEAAINAARDVVFSMLVEDDDKMSAAQRSALKAKYLLILSELMQEARKNDIRERAVAVDEQALQIKLDAIKEKAGKLIKAIEGGDGEKPMQLTREQLLEKVQEIYGAV